VNAMTLAIKNAGIPVKSQTERLWLMCKDHPGSTSNSLAQKTGVSEGNASSVLSQMVNRGMLVAGSVAMRVPGPRGVAILRNVKTYTVDPRMGGRYEALPYPPKRVKEVAPATVITPPESPSTASHAAGNVTSPTIGHLTIAEAHALYTQLHLLFGTVKS